MVNDRTRNVADARATLGGNEVAQNEFDRIRNEHIAKLAVHAAEKKFSEVTGNWTGLFIAVVLDKLVNDPTVADARATLGDNEVAQNEFNRLIKRHIAILSVRAATDAFGTLNLGAMANDFDRFSELVTDAENRVANARKTLRGNI